MIAGLRCGTKQTEFIDLVADYGGRWAEVWIKKSFFIYLMDPMYSQGR